MPHFEIVKFSEAYDFAWFTWSLFVKPSTDEDDESLMDLLPSSEERVAARLLRPHRDTLLHLFLRRLYTASYIKAFEQHRNDMLDLVVNEYETVLRFNEVSFKPLVLPAEIAPDFELVALRRIAYLRKRLPLDRIAQDTFQLLFRDRQFLLTFNQTVADNLRNRPKVRRVSLPSWMRRGVFYRDNGRCVGCAKDLTGADIMGDAIHYDHIIPLANHGSNDPTNFQILCGPCNQDKATRAHTSERYPVFWSVERDG